MQCIFDDNKLCTVVEKMPILEEAIALQASFCVACCQVESNKISKQLAESQIEMAKAMTHPGAVDYRPDTKEDVN